MIVSSRRQPPWRWRPRRDDIMAPPAAHSGLIGVAVAVGCVLAGIALASQVGAAPPAPMAKEGPAGHHTEAGARSPDPSADPQRSAAHPPTGPGRPTSRPGARPSSGPSPAGRAHAPVEPPTATVSVTRKPDPDPRLEQGRPEEPTPTITVPAPAPPTVTVTAPALVRVTVSASPTPAGSPQTNGAAPQPQSHPSPTGDPSPEPTPDPSQDTTPGQPPVAPPRGAVFGVASFNILGSSHTGGYGADQHPSWRSGRARMSGMVAALRRHRVEVAGLQEVQRSQRHAFTRAAGPQWSQYPRAGSGGDNRIVWRTGVFTLVGTRTFTIPYFNGHRTRMPVVLLEHRGTGQRVWVASIHNPAETGRYHHQGRFRARALARERDAVGWLRRTGNPVLLTGDFNQHGPAFCTMTRTQLSVSAYGARPGRGCRVPRHSGIDWIFGAGGVRFSGYRSDWSPDRAHISDHPIISATVTVSAHTGATVAPSTTTTPSVARPEVWTQAPHRLVPRARWNATSRPQ